MSYTNYEWFLQQDLKEYAGRWIAIIDRKVVGSEKNVDVLMAEVKANFPKKVPLITKVRTKLSILNLWMHGFTL